MPKSGAKSFEAVLERGGAPLNWVIARIPFDAAKLWGKRGHIRVNGRINGFAFSTTLFPTGHGGHYLLVNKRMQKGGRASLGETASFRLEPDQEERQIAMPAELTRSLAAEPALRRWYRQMNQSTRAWIEKWVGDVKSPQARVRRAEQITERLYATMEAERDLPPILRAAFARDARAEAGWKRMPLSRRRSHLLGLFYYRTPEGRAGRVAKLIADARTYGSKGETGSRQ
ncbi:MAG TPA: YdeI/OmpD-associated family protein [Bryobacteraceae bacterium]|nr:YdeI/OmpD-associated family protein [Bryobacteraceae bacterium]